MKSFPSVDKCHTCSDVPGLRQLTGCHAIQEEGGGSWQREWGALQRNRTWLDPAWICWLKPAFDLFKGVALPNERPQSSCAWKCLPLSGAGQSIDSMKRIHLPGKDVCTGLLSAKSAHSGWESVLGNPFLWCLNLGYQYGLFSIVQPFRLYLEIFSVLARPVFNTFLPE